MIKLKNVWLVVKDQMPVRRMFRNFVITRNAWGLFTQNSHISSVSAKQKVTYNRKVTAEKAAKQMAAKTGNRFSPYKCLFCDGYHIGKTRR